jgi:adenylate cyclase
LKEQQQITRKLTAILAADVTGYSRLMGADEEGTLRRLEEHRRDVIDPKLLEHHGRIVKTTGDGLLAEFTSVVDAVRSAVEIQMAMAERNATLPSGTRMDFRIGINLGDVITRDDDIYGDGVNIASRIEGLADPGGICLSKTVVDQVQDKLDLKFEDMGERKVKNIARPVRVLRVVLDGTAKRRGTRARWRAIRLRDLRVWIALAMLVLVIMLGTYAPALFEVGSSIGTLSQGGPSIAVLPFSASSGDRQQTLLADALSEDILTQLARVSGLNVVSREAAVRYRNALGEAARAFHGPAARYILTGSVLPAGDQVRVTAQLIEVASREQVWAQHYDLSSRSLPKAQDELTESITTQLVVQMHNRDLQLAKATAAEKLDSYGFYLLGMDALARDDFNGIILARQMFERAITANAAYAPALAGRALIALREFQLGRAGVARDAALSGMFELAQKALALDPAVSNAQQVVANVYLYRGQYDQAIDLLRNAIASSADDIGLQESLADVSIYAGDYEEGTQLVDRVIRLDPFHDQAVYAIYGRGYILADQLSKAIENLEICMARASEYRPCFDSAAVAYAESAQMVPARDAVRRSRQLDPGLSLSTISGLMPFKRAGDLRRFQNGLAVAGLK